MSLSFFIVRYNENTTKVTMSKDPTTAVARIPLEMPNFFSGFLTEGVGVTPRKEIIILII